jgi:hypothetical protein
VDCVQQNLNKPTTPSIVMGIITKEGRRLECWL